MMDNKQCYQTKNIFGYYLDSFACEEVTEHNIEWHLSNCNATKGLQEGCRGHTPVYDPFHAWVLGLLEEGPKDDETMLSD